MIPIVQGLMINSIYNVKDISFTFFTISLNSSWLGGISVLLALLTNVIVFEEQLEIRTFELFVI
jgi:hypothetical protein